jgi:hypothetical protein
MWCAANAGGSQVSASLTYYVGEMRYAILRCPENHAQSKKSFRVELVGMHPVVLAGQKEAASGVPEVQYELLKLGDVTQVIEHRAFSNKFWVVYDPRVIADVQAQSNGK